MKNITLILAFLICGFAHGAVSVDQKFLMNNSMGGVAAQVQLGTLLDQAELVNGTSVLSADTQATFGHMLKRIARVDYLDSAVRAKLTGTGLGTATLGVALPGGSVITRSYADIRTQFVDGGSGLITVGCGATGNIMASQDITLNAAGSVIEGVSTGTALTMKQIPTDCNVSVVVSTASQSAGEAIIFIEYVLAR